MHLTLAQIRTFERIAKLGSFRAAARQLGLTQPSVSQRIRELEDALGAQLFVRRGPAISLTVEGTALVAYADRLLGTADEMVARFRAHDPLKGLLRLGLNETFGLVCLPDLLRHLEEQYPALKTSVQVGDTGTISRMLNEQQLDIAIISEPERADHVRYEAIGINELAWFASADFAGPRGVHSPEDLGAQHLIVTPPPSRLYMTATQWFARAGVVPSRLSMCNSVSVTILTITRGLAIGLVPVRVMQEQLARDAVRRLAVSPPVPGHRVSICYQVSEFGPSMQRLVELIRELVRRHKLFA